MPKIPKNKRVAELRRIRNNRIRVRFEEFFNSGLRYDIVIAKLIEEFCLCESTLSQIVKKQGKYKDN